MSPPGSLPTVVHRPATLSLLLGALLLLRNGPSPGQQEPAPTPGEGGSSPSKTRTVADLTLRYRFSERYTSDDKLTGPGVVGSYRVAAREVVRDSVEQAQGAPKRTESTRQAIYAERPAELGGGVGGVTSASRVFEAFQARSQDPADPTGARPLEGVAVLVKPKVGELPLVLCLSENRTLTEAEHEAVSRQVFVPHLAALLPPQAVRLGDTWRVARKGAQALLGDPFIQTDTLTGKLAEVTKEVDGPRMVATIAVTGKATGPSGDSNVNARLLFTFPGSPPAKDPAKKPAFPPSPSEGLIEARGAITEVSLAKVTAGPLPGPARLRFQSNRELTLHRQLGPPAAGAPAPPTLEKMPEVTEANSWLAHLDPAGRYSFRHPQDLLPPERTQPAAGPDTSLLMRTRREGRDMLQVEYFAKNLTTEDLKKELAGRYAAFKGEVIKGGEDLLSEVEWPGLRAHRIEAAVKLSDPQLARSGAPTRLHFAGYLLQFPRSASILAIASTSRESAAPFRKEVEDVLKSIRLDPPRTIPLDKAPRIFDPGAPGSLR